jgi:hypothetical protein
VGETSERKRIPRAKKSTCGMMGIRRPMKPRMKKKIARIRFKTLFRRAREARGKGTSADAGELKIGLQ